MRGERKTNRPEYVATIIGGLATFTAWWVFSLTLNSGYVNDGKSGATLGQIPTPPSEMPPSSLIIPKIESGNMIGTPTLGLIPTPKSK